VDALQRAVPIPQHEVGMGRALGRQVLGQRLPLAARGEHIENRVENLPHVDRSLTTAALGGGIIGAIRAHSASVRSDG